MTTGVQPASLSISNLSAPVSQLGPDGKRVLTEPWTVLVEGQSGPPVQLTVPEGFVYRPSVPRMFRDVVTPPLMLPAACLHDYLYNRQGEVPAQIQRPGGEFVTVQALFSQQEADDLAAQIFAQTSEIVERPIPRWQQYLFYGAIRGGGWYLWHDLDEQSFAATFDFLWSRLTS